MSYRKEPVYITPKDTYFAEDKIIPYSGRIRIRSESHIKAAVLRLWGLSETTNEEKKGKN